MSRKSKGPRLPRRAFVPGFFQGLTTYFRVMPTLFKYKLWPLQFIPAFLSLFLSTGMVTLFWFFAKYLSEWVDTKVDLIPLASAGEWYSDLLPWVELDGFITSSMGVMTFLLLCIGFIFMHKHVILVLLSPFLGKLAEATYQRVMDDTATSPLTVFQSFQRGVRINLGNIIKEVSLNIIFFACNLIPGFGNVIAGSGIFFNQSRFMGYGLMDSTLEHKGLSVKESLRFVSRHSGHSTGVGAGYILLMMIPLIGWMFAPTFGTVAGTLVAIDEFNKDDEQEKQLGLTTEPSGNKQKADQSPA